MAEYRSRPYSQFNFRVSWDGLDENDVKAGFQEVSGLGLEITRRFCKKLGGDITAKSKMGEGSTFTIKLPNPDKK